MYQFEITLIFMLYQKYYFQWIKNKDQNYVKDFLFNMVKNEMNVLKKCLIQKYHMVFLMQNKVYQSHIKLKLVSITRSFGFDGL